MKTLSCYLGTFLVSLLILIWALALWQRDLGMPLLYGGDTLFFLAIVKGFFETGSLLENPALGAPSIQVLYDFAPLHECFHMGVLWCLGKLGADPFLAINIYYFLTYPLTVLASLFVLRRWGISYGPALLSSILFGFLPYHVFRSVVHLTLSAYYLIPLMVMVIAALAAPEAVFFRSEGERPSTRMLRITGSLALCVVFAAAHIYYSFFTCFFLLVVGLAAAISRRQFRPLGSALVLVSVFALVFGALGMPSRSYLQQNGDPGTVAIRLPSDADDLALKVSHLIMPVDHHRLFAKEKVKYNASFSRGWARENRLASLGFVGAFGFLALVLLALFAWFLPGGLAWTPPPLVPGKPNGPNGPKGPKGPKGPGPPGLLGILSLLNLSAVFLASPGGLGVFVALYVSPLIRSYNRISIFIGFFALAAVALLLEGVRRRWVRTRRQEWVFGGLLVAVVAAGILDQIPPGTAERGRESEPRFVSDADFVRKIEERLPENAMVFQLPYQDFPEGAPKNGMDSYAPIVGYLHSNSLRFSFGAIRGRGADLWQKSVAQKPAVEFLQDIAAAGFSGVWVCREGYRDRAAEFEFGLQEQLRTQPLESRDGRFTFWDIRQLAAGLEQKHGKEEWKRLCRKMPPVQVLWCRGIGPRKGNDQGPWRWSASMSSICLENLSRVPQKVRVNMQLASFQQELSKLEVRWGDSTAEIDLGPDLAPFSTTLVLAPGTFLIELRCDGLGGNVATSPGMTRHVALKIVGFQLITVP